MHISTHGNGSGFGKWGILFVLLGIIFYGFYKLSDVLCVMTCHLSDSHSLAMTKLFALFVMNAIIQADEPSMQLSDVYTKLRC